MRLLIQYIVQKPQAIQWKDLQINNGILEGLNSILQAAKCNARGYTFKQVKTIAFLVTGKLNVTK